MSAWLIIIALVSVASMPTAFRMARARGRSTWLWLEAAMLFGPLALVALLVLGERRDSSGEEAAS
jgi:bacteriorhodopsin